MLVKAQIKAIASRIRSHISLVAIEVLMATCVILGSAMVAHSSIAAMAIS